MVRPSIPSGVWAVTARFSHEPAAAADLVLMTLTLAVVALSTTLGGTDDALDRTAALPWPPRRAAHLIGMGAIAAALFALTLPTGTAFGPGAVIVRDVAGATGLVALGALLLGPRRAWFPMVVWTVPALIWATPGRHEALSWMVQPTDSRPAALMAAGLATAGVLGYARFGSPRRLHGDLTEAGG